MLSSQINYLNSLEVEDIGVLNDFHGSDCLYRYSNFLSPKFLALHNCKYYMLYLTFCVVAFYAYMYQTVCHCYAVGGEFLKEILTRCVPPLMDKTLASLAKKVSTRRGSTNRSGVPREFELNSSVEEQPGRPVDAEVACESKKEEIIERRSAFSSQCSSASRG